MELYKKNEIKNLSFEQILEKEGAGEETDTYETVGQILYDPDIQTTHLNNILLGNDTGKKITTGGNNTLIGFQAGFSNTSGRDNFFAGAYAGFSNTSGYNNCYIGGSAGYFGISAYNNIAIGNAAMQGYSGIAGTAYDNTVIGFGSGLAMSSGHDNIGFGNYSLGGGNVPPNYTVGNYNVCLGKSSGYLLVSGSSNFFGGYLSGASAVSSNANVNIGESSGYANVGDNNVFVGYKSGFSNTSGFSNLYIGFESGYSNVTGNNGVYLGTRAGYYETGANKLFIDNAQRANEADGRLKALLYGVFSSTVAGQSLAINAILKVNSTAGLYGIFDMSSIATADKTFTFPNASGTVALTSNLGTIASQNSNNVSITGGSISGITDIAVADGGTGASTATGACSNLGLGTEDNVQFNGVLLQRGDDTNHTLNDLYHIGDTYSNFFSGYRARASTSIVASGDVLFFIAGKGYDGAAYKTAAYMTFEVDGTPGINDMPGRIVFYTTPDGDQYGVERMRIKSGGNVSFSGAIEVDNVQVVGNRVVDARCDDTINSGDATTDGVIDALRDAMIAHGLIAAA